MTGPPISNAVIAPNIAAKGILPARFNVFNQLVKPSISNEIGAPITQTIIPPVIKVPNNGYKNIDPKDFKEIGNFIFFNAFTTYPAINPATIPPKKPAPI